jgi:hypothetical protein
VPGGTVEKTGKPQVEQKTYSIKIQAKELTNDGVL